MRRVRSVTPTASSSTLSAIPCGTNSTERTIALGFDELRKTGAIALVAGTAKRDAAHAFLQSGVARGLIIDGDTALALAGA